MRHLGEGGAQSSTELLRAGRCASIARMKTGIERLVGEEAGLIRGKKLGALVHPASVDGGLRHTVSSLLAHGADLRLLFGPEHGVLGEAQDMEAVAATAQTPWNLPVHNLYGHSFESLRPRREALAGLDALLVDLQDIGSRYYTFIYTMALCMEACHEAGVEVIVLDRPNPIGGMAVEGGTVHDGYRSFVGLYPLANRHGLTIAEVASYLQRECGVGAPPTIVRMSGWRRAELFDETGLPWVLTSPNMPTLQTALVYPGMCLLEGTDLSEGRGTTRPFELFGAPFIEPNRLVERLEAAELPGVRFRPCFFKPTFQKHAGVLCGGAQLHVIDRAAFRPYLTGVACLLAVRSLWPKEFRWRERAYEFVTNRPAIDLLAGSDRLRRQLDAGTPLAEIAASWRGEEAAFAARRAEHLLYT
jgi:uncharacterized protein YbbC (DUF1343 family)